MFAVFWILLGGASGLYLFGLYTDPAALGAYQLTAKTPDKAPETPAPSQPAPSQASAVSDADIDELKASLQAVSQQLAGLDARLKPIEKFIGPVAALPPSASVTTSPPPPPTPPPAQSAAPAAEPAPAEPAAAPEEDEAEEPAAKAAMDEPPAEEPETEPEAQDAAPEAAAEAPAEEAEEPASVAAAPMEDESDDDASTPADAAEPASEEEIAALDPVILPPAANDGSTRYGIEIGSVTKSEELRPLWREYLTKHAALVAGLQPRRILAPDKTWRLIAGPFANAQDAEGACSLFKKADRPCAATVYAGDSL